MSNDDLAYDRGDPKRSDWRPPIPCALCGADRGHYDNCPEVHA